MWNTIEVAAEIRINNLSVSGVDQLVDVLHRVQCAAVCSIGILFWRQIGLEIGSRTSTAAVCTTRSRIVGTVNANCTRTQ